MRPRLARVPLAALLAAGLAGSAVATPLSEQERRGRQLYFECTSPSGAEVTALLTGPGVEVDASTMPCAGCHGADGLGRPEGGVDPSDVSWLALTKAYGVRHRSGREHPPYDEQSLGRAITAGVDPAGQLLHEFMPRYGFSERDLADLVAYIKRLGTDLDPGLTETSITIGTILPMSGRLAGAGEAARAALEAYFASINEQGGIYRRRLLLRVVPLQGNPAGTASVLRRELEAERLFALVGVFMAGAEAELTEVVERLAVPTVGPVTPRPVTGTALRGHVFYLAPGVAGEARSLVSFAARQLEGREVRWALLEPERGGLPGLAEAAREVAAQRGWVEVAGGGRSEEDDSDPAAEAMRLREAEVDVLFLLGGGDHARALLEAGSERGWQPQVLLPGGLAGRSTPDLARICGNRLYVGFGATPGDRTRAGLVEYAALAESAGLPMANHSIQLQALAAAKTLVEGLKRVGHNLSRSRLVVALESLRDFETGLTRPLSYGPNRRIGALGAHIVTIDPATGSPTSDSLWIGPGPD